MDGMILLCRQVVLVCASIVAGLLIAVPAALGTEVCDCPDCQAARAQADVQKAVASAYAPVFYNNNFAYINNPAYQEWYPGDWFKQIPIGDCWLTDFGGQYRARYHHEQNHRGLGLTGNDDDFLLHRTRLFANARYSDWFRFYGEFIDAESNYENFPSRAIEVNRADMLNLFADAKLMDEGGDLWFRVGRQELLYGSERLISPLDWANTRRTFEGLKFFWQSDDWNVDFFATRPVIVNPVQFDSPNYDQEFMGAWATYKAAPGQTMRRYPVNELHEGLNEVNGEQIYFIPTPSAGLWATREKLFGRKTGFV